MQIGCGDRPFQDTFIEQTRVFDGKDAKGDCSSSSTRNSRVGEKRGGCHISQFKIKTGAIFDYLAGWVQVHGR